MVRFNLLDVELHLRPWPAERWLVFISIEVAAFDVVFWGECARLNMQGYRGRLSSLLCQLTMVRLHSIYP
jgi:hypothetical protein